MAIENSQIKNNRTINKYGLNISTNFALWNAQNAPTKDAIPKIRHRVQTTIPVKLIPKLAERIIDAISNLPEKMQKKTARKYQSIFLTLIDLSIVTIQATTLLNFKVVSIILMI